MDRNPSGDTPGGGSSGDVPGEFTQEVQVGSLLPRSVGDVLGRPFGSQCRRYIGESYIEVAESKVTLMCDFDSVTIYF